MKNPWWSEVSKDLGLVGSLINGLFMAYKWGLLYKYFLNGVILQASTEVVFLREASEALDSNGLEKKQCVGFKAHGIYSM